MTSSSCALVWTTAHKCAMLRQMPRITLLMAASEYLRFEAYCESQGFKKSPLIARLVREHLDRENFYVQQPLDLEPQPRLSDRLKK